MGTLTIPPTRAEDIEPAKDFLFEALGRAVWAEADYLRLSEGLNRIVELSEGRLVIPTMPTPEHQDIVWNVAAILKAWARAHDGRAFVAALPVRLWPDKFREPDALLYTAQHADRVFKQYGGPPDLVVEVLSPSTERTDREEKLAEYAQAGIPEYWVVEVETPRLTQYVLAGERYALRAAYAAGATVRAETLAGLDFPLDQFYNG